MARVKVSLMVTLATTVAAVAVAGPAKEEKTPIHTKVLRRHAGNIYQLTYSKTPSEDSNRYILSVAAQIEREVAYDCKFYCDVKHEKLHDCVLFVQIRHDAVPKYREVKTKCLLDAALQDFSAIDVECNASCPSMPRE